MSAINAPFARGSETSRQAAVSIQADTSRLRKLVLNHIWMTVGIGATCDEVEVESGLSHQTCSARFRELAQRGQIIMKRDGEGRPVTRKTRSGRAAQVWIVK